MALLTESDRKRLLKNPHIERITEEDRIIFTADFKLHAIEENLKGQSPVKIFEEAGIELVLFGKDYPRDTLKRWRKVYKARGKDGLRENLQGKNSKGRPKKTFDPCDIKSLQARLAYLEEENKFLKKLRALEDQYRKKNGLN